MYPEGFSTRIAPEGAALAGLEDKFRPHFFGGVATVVGKLFAQVRPDIAVFGQKDYQQLQVVTQLSRDLDLAVKVIGLPTVRERDGLAMSSRNVYLTPDQRRAAPVLYATIKEAKTHLRRGDDLRSVMRLGAKRIAAAGFTIDYFEARHARTLAPIKSLDDGPVRLLVAARIGNVRLIDNAAV
jgi:pantoate--beta-alanine ligase